MSEYSPFDMQIGGGGEYSLFTLNSTIIICSEADWGKTVTSLVRWLAAAERAYQKYKLCHGSKLVEKKGSPINRDTLEAEEKG